MPKKIDLIGQRFNRLLVISELPIEERPNKKKVYWKCQCDCGNIINVIGDSLKNGKTSSCGCLRKEKIIEKNKSKIIDLTNQRFGKLVVLKQEESYRGHSAWLCQCDCGNTIIVNSVELKKGDTLSCGCLRSSYGEIIIENILKENNILYKKEYEFKDLLSENQIPLRFDFAILNENNQVIRVIEYDGEQHYLKKTNNFWTNDSLEKRQQRDEMKNKYCLINNIPLVRIPYWKKNNITYTMIMGDKYLI